MKKIFNLLLALPLLMLAACAEDQTLAPAEVHTYTIRACVAPVESRVAYEEESGAMNCKWEQGDIVAFQATDSTDTYDFTVTKVNADGSAVLSYTGNILNHNNFTGTATYAPRDNTKVGIQTANNNTEHLKYGETMVASLTAQPLDGATLTFSHPSSAVYKVAFKAPIAITAGSTLTLSGAWTDNATVTLNFAAAKDAIVTAYAMHTSGTIAQNGELKVALKVGAATYSYTHKSTKAVTYEAGKYWVSDISDKTLNKEIATPQPIDLGLSVKWADINLGASCAEDGGYRYGWGCTTPYDASMTAATWNAYFTLLGAPAGTSAADCGSAIDPLATFVNNSGDITTTDWDAAHATLGGHWRMPTQAELNELQSCTKQWVTRNGVNGIELTKNGNSIFLPAIEGMTTTGYFGNGAGNYWCSTSFSTKPASAYGSEIACTGGTNASLTTYDELRCTGYAIRPVYVENPKPQAIDLGLPSGTKWANFNVGASAPEEIGTYYGWGCTEPYAATENVIFNTYFLKLGAGPKPGGGNWIVTDFGTDNDPLKDYVTNKKSIAGTDRDAATKIYGSDWCMPTGDDVIELIQNCNWSWETNFNGVAGLNGYKASNKNDATKYIFLPAAGYRSGTETIDYGERGYIWSTTPNQSSTNYQNASYIDFSQINVPVKSDGGSRRLGYSIRAVSKPVAN